MNLLLQYSNFFYLQVKDNLSNLPLKKHECINTSSKLTGEKTPESVSLYSVSNPDLELKIQEMRENIAAKKIQRSWRQHQRNVSILLYLFFIYFIII